MHLIVGAGPVGLTVAALLQRRGLDYSFCLRDLGASRVDLLSRRGVTLSSARSCPALHGRVVKARVYHPPQVPSTTPLTLYLCTPHPEFVAALQPLSHLPIRQVVLPNSGLGSGAEVRSAVGRDVEVVVFSNFFGAAKLREDTLNLKALKKKVFLGSRARCPLAEEIASLGVEVENLGHSLDAELRNITLYSHTVFALSPYALEASFGLVPQPRYLYKLFPEGPVERRRTRLYARFFEDLMTLFEPLGASPFNLLKFLHEDNYPVSDRFLNSEEVEAYPTLPLGARGDLLFARYAGLLVDAGSEPDRNGRYFDFSAVPVPRLRWKEGHLELPRVMSEEVFHHHLLRRLAHTQNRTLPSLEQIHSELEAVKARLSAEAKACLKRTLERQQPRIEKMVTEWVDPS